jgi:WXG100 family type VII secretion target
VTNTVLKKVYFIGIGIMSCYIIKNRIKGAKIMSFGIGVNAEILHGHSNEIKGDSGELGQLIAKITNRINALDTDWKGQAATSFIQQWADLKPSFDKAQQLLDEIGTQLGQAATAYESFDAEMAAKIGH